MIDSDGVQVVQMESAGMAEQMAGAQIDRLVETAKRFPRSLKTFRETSIEMATFDEEVSASCSYALPRGGKVITGPSVKFAQIVAASWGNLWVQVTPVAQDRQFVTVRAVAWDVQTNLCIAFDVKRRITDRNGNTYNDDMITVTTNAAASIAYRNAVLRIVPEAYTRPALNAAREVVRGDAKTLSDRRTMMIAHFGAVGVDVRRVCAGVGVAEVEEIGLDELETLRGFATAIKEGDTYPDDVFPELDADGKVREAPKRKSADALADKLKGKAKAEPEPEPEPEPQAEPEAETIPI